MNAKHLASWMLIGLLSAGMALAVETMVRRTPREVVEHHIAAMLRHDATALLEDYANDAVVVLGSRVFNGKQQVRQLFAFSAGNAISNDHAEFNVARIDGDVVIEEWTHDTAGGGRVSGADVIVVRNGMIVFHTTR